MTKNSGGISNTFGHYFVAQVYTGASGYGITTPMDSNGNSNSFAWLDFDPTDPSTQEITIRVATSFISADQALLNLQQEVNKVSFADLYTEAKASWNKVLSRVNIVAIDNSYTNAEKVKYHQVFYSNLYRASLFPRQITEVSASGEVIHWSPYASGNASVFSGPLTTDSGFWDVSTHDGMLVWDVYGIYV